MIERQSAAHVTVGTAAAAPRPGREGERADEKAPVANPDIEHRQACGPRAPVEDVERFVLEFVEHADDKIHAARHIGVDQPRSGRSERPS